MAKQKHRILAYTDTQIKCQYCGWSDFVFKNGRKVCAVARRELNRKYESKSRSGLTKLEAEKLKALVGSCMICDREIDLVIDHCHESLKVRGVLCNTCNIGLGMFKDSIDLLNAAANYLHKHG